MDREELLELVTVEDIIEILKDLGSENYKIDNQGNLYFLNVCHGGDRYKLHFFKDSKMFMCYTCCGSLSLYDVIMSAKNIDFLKAYNYVCDFKGISVNHKMKKGLQKKSEINSDLEFLKLHLYKKTKAPINLPHYDKRILKLFDDYMPYCWFKEGIKEGVANHFDIKMYFNQNKAIIPHYDINGNLVGVRARSFNSMDIENGKKYMPITIQGLTYRYPMNYNLYGIYQNKENIRKFKKAIIVEGEKSVQLYGSYYGQENNIALATCGMTFSLYQRDLLVSLGVEEIVIAYDKQYRIELIDNVDIDKKSKLWKEYENYIKRLIKISEVFINYCKVSIISCWDETLDYKDAPLDKGKETFERLYKDRYLISDIEELKEMID